jgi:hypothetical protein
MSILLNNHYTEAKRSRIPYTTRASTPLSRQDVNMLSIKKVKPSLNNPMRKLIHLPLSILFITISTVCNAQFAGIVGTVGTTAMYKDSSAFVNWATQCTVKRGLQNITNTAGGYATTGADSNAIGKAGTNGVVSLGDRGEALLRFQYPITNAEGYK